MHDPYGLGPRGQGSPYGQPPGNPNGFGAPPQHGYVSGPGYNSGHGAGGGGPAYPPPPGPQGYVSYGQGMAPPNIYTPPANVETNELRKLEDDAQLWLLVAAAGFWVGFGWVTGPLAWYFGSQIRGKYRALGHHPCASANWAWGIGIVSTAIYALGVVALITAIGVFVGALAL